MVESVVSFVMQGLSDLLIQEAKYLHGVSDQVQQLQTELRGMKLLLKDADRRQDKDESVRNWVSEISDVTYDVEDVIETFALKVASRRREGIRNILNRYSCIFNEFIELHNVGSEIESIKTRISNLATNLQNHGIKAIREPEGSSSTGYDRQQQLRRTYSHVMEKDTVGLEEDVKKLVEHLVNEEKHSRVVSVCGMGGLGKTTLAKKIYHHNNIRQHFDGFAWAYISQQCQVRNILQGILINLLSSSKAQINEILNMRDEDLIKKLFQVQQEKKCLVVLDDIWTVRAWDCLKPAFPEGKVGSKILLTTRIKEVALRVDPRGFLHEPRCLNGEESWKLFQKKAFVGEDGPGLRVDTNMEQLGREMVGQCAGLPLAIVVLGGLLATKHTLKEWDMVHENMQSYLRRDEGHEEGHLGVFDVLALSYNELPYHLKPCFLYLGHFPEDFEIPKNQLVRMWVAEGFVSRPLQYQGLMEDVAERYLGELIERCMVQVGERGSTGNVKTCRLHDLMRDMCLSKAEQEHFLEVIDLRHGNEPADSSSSSMVTIANSTPGRVRRLSIHLCEGVDRYFPFKHKTTSRLRSLLFFYTRECGITNWRKMEFMFRDFTLLRVLNLQGFLIDGKLPRAIGNLIHLRYLSFRFSGVDELPSSVGNLRFLQTLNLKYCNTMKIPNVIWKMERLRHLYLPYRFNIESNDKMQLDNLRIQLSNLVTLTNFDTEKCVVKQLFESTTLRKLGMNNLYSLKDLEVILKSPNVTLNNLRSLSLGFLNSTVEEADLKQLLSSCHHLYKLCLQGWILKLPEYHQFPPNLTKLKLMGSQLVEDPMATLEKLTNLRILWLWSAFIGKEMVCSAKGFPQLKYLMLYELSELEEWRVDEGAMPSLCRLVIYCCEELKMVPDGMKFVTTLRQLKIMGEPEAFNNRLRVVNGEEGEDLYKVKHVPSITIEDWN